MAGKQTIPPATGLPEGALFEVFFRHERDTKGAVRYFETATADPADVKALGNNDGAKIGTQYIRKEAFPGDAPKGLRFVAFPIT